MFAPLSLALAMASIVAPSVSYELLRDYSGQNFFNGWDYYGSWDNLTLSECCVLFGRAQHVLRPTHIRFWALMS